MTETPASRRRHRWDRGSVELEAALLAAVAYVPFLASSPGRLSSDSKQALYVDPGAFLREAPFLWDPTVGAGTVPHQHIGYLWPMGPWFWLFDRLGSPDWIAQRLWLGTLTLLAALGTRWLLRSLGLPRAAALAGALVYALSPYQLAFTARTSVLLLPWVGLPWLVELTRRAVYHGGWRHPALFALVTFSVAGVNAASLVLVSLGPLAVLVDAGRPSRSGAGRAVTTAARIGVLTVPVCLWWLAGLRVQGGYGMPVLQVTENLRTVAERSTPDDVLRGLGNWFFYGRDRAGWSLDQTDYYEHHRLAIALSFVVPVLALAVATVLRWSHRALAVALLGATAVAVGAWPYDSPSPVGRLFRFLVEATSAGMAFRNHPRVVPVVVLSLAMILAAGVAAVPGRGRWVASGVVVLAAAAGLAPVARVGMLSEGMNRPEELPDHWSAATADLDSAGPHTRVLELPGANFADYRWGNAVEPVTPLLMDRPYLAREILPQGSPASALLVDALDRRIQNGVADPDSIAPIARLLGVGTVVLRNDLRFERFDLPSPDTMWNLLVSSEPAGLGDPRGFGDPVVNRGDPELDSIYPSDLDRPGAGADRDAALVPVVPLEVQDSVGIVRVAPVEGSVVVDGDADGIVDAASAGLIDGRSIVLMSGSLTSDQLRGAVDSGAALILTDGNRRRIQTWFYSLRDTRGPTEEVGETMIDPSGYDSRLQAFPDPDDLSRSVADQIGATVRATSAGGGAARPEDRPVAAVDGRIDSAWRVGGADPTGETLSIRLDRPQTVDRIVLVQPQDGPKDRVVTKVRLRRNGAPPVDVALGASSMTPAGQVVEIPEGQVRELSIEILDVSDPGMDPALANAVGFAEVGVGDLRVQQSVRLPTDLLGRLGPGSDALSLDVVLTRLRTGVDLWRRHDDEATLDRTFSLPSARSFGLAGTIRPSGDASDELIDDLLGTRGSMMVTSSSRLQGSPDARSSRAFDGDGTTAWTSAFQESRTGGGEWVEITSDRPIDLARTLQLDVVADGLHSVPTSVTVEVDGRPVATQRVQPPSEPLGPGETTTLTVALDDSVTSGRKVRIRFDSIEPRLTDGSQTSTALPLAVTEVRGVQSAVATTGIVDPACRSDLLRIDGRPVSVRLGEPSTDGTITVESCAAVRLGAGQHRLSAADGTHTGIDVDALTLSSNPGRTAGEPAVRGRDIGSTPATVTSSDSTRTGITATVQAAGAPFWFVTGQSANAGWSIEVTGATVGPRTLVDGYSDGWILTPSGAGPVTVELTWTPQRTVWTAMVISLVALVLAAALAVLSRSRGPVPPLAPPSFAPLRSAHPASSSGSELTTSPRGPLSNVGALCVAGLGTAAVIGAVSRPWIALLAGVTAAVVTRWRNLVWVAAPAAGLALALARPLGHPEFGWLAIGLVAAGFIGTAVRSRLDRRPREHNPA